MEIGSILLFLSFIFSLSSTFLFSYALRAKKQEFATYGERLIYAALSVALAAFLLLVYYFITDNFAIYYVYANSHKPMGIFYKISATWAGKEGSLLLWNLFSLVITTIYISTSDRDYSTLKAATVLAGVSTSILIINNFLSSPFATLPFTPTDGVGLNPLLRTTEMVLHPPVIFFGYALAAVPYALYMAGEESKAKIWAKVTWIFLSVGIFLGAWWSYRTLGWGGFWGWDPVENASILPWITITAYFHARGKLKDLMTILTFLFVIFAAFVTRSGIIKSVHAFGESYTGFVYLLILGFFGIIAVRNYIKRRETTKFGGVLFYAVALFIAMVLVIFIGTTASIFVSIDRVYYHFTFVPLFAALVGLLLYYVMKKKMNKRALVLHIGVILLFLGSVSVWGFEQRYEGLVLNPSAVSGEYRLKLVDVWFDEDAEKITVYSKVEIEDVGVLKPKQYIYKIDRNERVTSSVELISYPWFDYYLAIRGFSNDFSSVTVDFYLVPLISLVWVGFALMFVGVLGRLGK